MNASSFAMSRLTEPSGGAQRFSFLVDAIVQHHDPSTTQLSRLKSSYESTGDFLASRPEFSGLLEQIHPHGSRQLGTMLRPSDLSRVGFDVDLIALLGSHALDVYPGTNGPAHLLSDIYAALKDYAEAHSLRIQRHDRCVTLTYADGMSADIAPVIAFPQLARLHGEHHVLIPDRTLRSFTATNPKGYAAVFNDIAKISPLFPQTAVLRADTFAQDSAEIVPLAEADEVFGRLLCRFVQLIKLHRNAWFGSRAGGDAFAPSSTFLTSLAASGYAATAHAMHNGPLDLLIDVAGRLPTLFVRERSADGRETWSLPNPCVPSDNLAGSMDSAEKRLAFDLWSKALVRDLRSVAEVVDGNLGNDKLVEVIRSTFGERSASALKTRLSAVRQQDRSAQRVTLLGGTGATVGLHSRNHSFFGD